jgi:hypothetical protein
MHLAILTVAGCPHGTVLERRLAIAPAGRQEISVTRQIITDEHQAARAGMHGSPALLIDGSDPFAAPDGPPRLSCRIYREPGGHAESAPSIAALSRAFDGSLQ